MDITSRRHGAAPTLEHVRVADAMHHGIFTCGPEAPLSEVARIMATRHVHAVAVADASGPNAAGVISDLDVVAAIATDEGPSACRTAATESPAISADESLERAAQLMVEHGVAHLLVSDPASGLLIGVLSTLDIAAVYAAQAGA